MNSNTAVVTQLPTADSPKNKSTPKKKTTTKRKAPAKKKAPAKVAKTKINPVVPTFGIFTPLFTLWISHAAGVLARSGSHHYLWIAAAALGCTMLFLSLTHVAAAIKQIAKVSVYQAWAYAVTLDLGIVFCEVALTIGELDRVTLYWTRGMLVAVLALSAWLNVYTLVGMSRAKRS